MKPLPPLCRLVAVLDAVAAASSSVRLRLDPDRVPVVAVGR